MFGYAACNCLLSSTPFIFGKPDTSQQEIDLTGLVSGDLEGFFGVTHRKNLKIIFFKDIFDEFEYIDLIFNEKYRFFSVFLN